MQTIFTILIIIVCVLLILVVLIQNSKGGGISSNFSAANQIMGARRGTDVVEKATWTLAILLLVLSLLSAPKTGSSSGDAATTSETGGSATKDKAGANLALPSAPAPAQPQAPATK